MILGKIVNIELVRVGGSFDSVSKVVRPKKKVGALL